MEKISIVILTKNNEHTIGRCLESIKGLSDDIIILDGMSTDRTVAVCRKFTDRIYPVHYTEETIDFAKLRNLGAGKARHEWIFAIDSDEVVSPELRREIMQFLKKGASCDGLYIKRRDFVFLETPITTTNILRIYRKSKGAYRHRIHESVSMQGETQTLDGLLYHHSFRDVADYFARHNKYTTLEARNLYAQNKHPSNIGILITALVKTPVEFLLWYFVKGLWKQGYVGFFCACCSGFYQFMKYLKYYELVNQKQK